MENEKLLKLKQEIDTAKTQLAILEDREKQLLAKLTKDWNVNSLEEARIKLDKMQDNLNNEQIEIKKLTEKLMSEFEQMEE